MTEVEPKKDDRPLFDARIVHDSETGERWLEALCVFCGKALWKLSKEEMKKGTVPKTFLV